MTYEDDRTPDERNTHHTIIMATDGFLSGWGGAEGGASYAGWACRWEDRAKVRAWLASRSEMLRIRQVAAFGKPYRPNARYCAHCHVYVVRDGHPALA